MFLKELLDKEIKEVSMSPTSLTKFLNSPAANGIKAGFELEVIVPIDDSGEVQPDYDHDITVYDDDEVISFFSGGDNPLTRRERGELRVKITDDFDEYIEKLTDKLVQEEGDEYIIDLAKDDDMEEDDIKVMIKEKTQEYYEYRETVIDELRDRVRNDVSWRDFWNSKNIDTMLDVATTYNLEWPYYSKETKKETIIKNLADEIETDLGIKVNSSDSYHGVSRRSTGGSNSWILEPDSSIEVPDDSYIGLELITPTPPPSAQESLKYIDNVFDWARKKGCKTNDSTGFHINVSLPSNTTQNIDYVKLVLFLGDEYVLKRFGRIGNTYAKSSFKLLDRYLDRPDFNLEKALAAIRGGLIDVATQEMNNPQRDKYVSVNMKANYIEFRSAGGDYLNNQNEIKDALMRYVRAIAIAGDPNAERQEYLKKLYKFLNPDNYTENTETVRIFARYNAGMITIQELKNYLKIRADRKQKNLPKKPQ